MVLYGTVQRAGKIVSDVLARMKALRLEREGELAALAGINAQARAIVTEAYYAGHGSREIAKIMGVTTRTVYAWLDQA